MSDLPDLGWASVDADRTMDQASQACTDLWRAALWQVIADASGHSGSKRGRIHTARSWLSTPSRDRRVVLELAGVDPDAFVSRGLPRLQAEWTAADAAPAQERRHQSAASNEKRRAGLLAHHARRHEQRAA